MNYDKLSRSIRQYYKKGIIRKPDVSQRLVYQFVHPVWNCWAASQKRRTRVVMTGDNWKKPLTAVLAPALTMHCIDCLLHCALLPNFNILMCNLIAYGNLLSHCIRYVMFYISNIVETILILIVQYFIFTNVNSICLYTFSLIMNSH